MTIILMFMKLIILKENLTFKNSSAKFYIDYLLKDDQANAQAFARKILGSGNTFS